jgi:hypothetical protein
VAIFKSPEPLLELIKILRKNGHNRLEAFSPFRLEEVNALLHPRKSPVRIWTLAGAIFGCIGGFWLAIGSAHVNNLYVGGKFSPETYIPYCIVGFEGLILIGAISNLAGMLFHTRLGQIRLPACYSKRFTRDGFGLFVSCLPDQISHVKTLLSSFDPEEIHVIP